MEKGLFYIISGHARIVKLAAFSIRNVLNCALPPSAAESSPFPVAKVRLHTVLQMFLSFPPQSKHKLTY